MKRISAENKLGETLFSNGQMKYFSVDGKYYLFTLFSMLDKDLNDLCGTY